MLTLDERIKQTEAKVSKLKQQRRIQEKRERERCKKRDQRRNYILGELVSKYFPEVLSLEPGTKAENTITFASFEAFLSTLASDQECINQIKRKVSSQIQQI